MSHYSKIISCDVGWKNQKNRNATVVITEAGQAVRLERGLDDDRLVDFISDWADPGSLILLDVPIEGCRDLKSPRRPIENAVQHYISLFPASMAGSRGEELEERILRRMPTMLRQRVVVKEVYPYAVYKFLWFAKRHGKLEEVVRSRCHPVVLDDSFVPSSTPPRYKGGKVNLEVRLEGMCHLHDLLTRDLALTFTQPLEPPHAYHTRRESESLADLYDACLGGVVGWYSVVGNPCAWLAGDEHQGEMLLLADQWLKAELESRGIVIRPLIGLGY